MSQTLGIRIFKDKNLEHGVPARMLHKNGAAFAIMEEGDQFTPVVKNTSSQKVAAELWVDGERIPIYYSVDPGQTACLLYPKSEAIWKCFSAEFMKKNGNIEDVDVGNYDGNDEERIKQCTGRITVRFYTFTKGCDISSEEMSKKLEKQFGASGTVELHPKERNGCLRAGSGSFVQCRPTQLPFSECELDKLSGEQTIFYTNSYGAAIRNLLTPEECNGYFEEDKEARNERRRKRRAN